MTFLSLNCKGLDSTLKKIALNRLVQAHKLNIISLQGALGDRENWFLIWGKLFSRWKFSFIDVHGHSRGLITRWFAHSFYNSNMLYCDLGLGIVLYSQDLGKEIIVMNLYDPYSDKVALWEYYLEWIF
jgi:hypothetical protein